MRLAAKVEVVKLNKRANRARAEKALTSAMESLRNELWHKIEEVTGQSLFDLRTLRRMGHPYARAHPHPPTPQGFVNKQTNDFYGDWEVIVTVQSGKASVAIRNRNWKAALLSKGSPRMIGRYYGKAIMKGMDEKYVRAVVREFSKMMKVTVTKK